MRVINSELLLGLRTAYSTLFHARLEGAASVYQRIASRVPSTGRSNTYSGLKGMSGLREWVGPRVIDNLSEFEYEIVNKSFEKTVAIDRDDMEDDNLGAYQLAFDDMFDRGSTHPDELTFASVLAGVDRDCFDGQRFFDSDHPVTEDDGETMGTFSNVQAGAYQPWILMCTRKAIRPFIFQSRKEPQFVAMDNPNDERVFMNKQFVYGVDSRCSTGYGLPQTAFFSQAELTAANYAAARQAITEMVGDGGRKLGLVPDLLLCGPANEGKALKILKNSLGDGGATNEWAGTAEPLMTPWLAA